MTSNFKYIIQYRENPKDYLNIPCKATSISKIYFGTATKYNELTHKFFIKVDKPFYSFRQRRMLNYINVHYTKCKFESEV